MYSNLIFYNYKERCSKLGLILTNLERITPAQLKELDELACRKIASNDNPKLALTPTMKSKLKELITKRDSDDELPTGAISHLDEVFRNVYWKRKRDLSNKYLEKGNLTEQDVLKIAGLVDNDFYLINKENFENDFIKGKWDNYNLKVRDAKSNYDLKSFEEAELTTLYKSQLNGYSIMLKEKHKLDYYPIGELIYGLVNNPLHHVQNEINKQFYALGNPSDDNDKWIETKRQIERNMIFDIQEFKKEYPFYVFENENLDFDIPAILRVKKFEVLTTENDEHNIKRRVLMSRIYLCNKEIAINNKLKQ